MIPRSRPRGPPSGSRLLRGLALAVAVLLSATVSAEARKETPSNKVSASLSGAVAVVSRWTDELTGNRAEFERDFVLPSRLSVPWLDLFYDAAQPATVDLWLRSLPEEDRTARLVYRDLRAYVLTLHYGESSFHDRPSDALSHRRTYGGDFYLRRFNQHPIHLFWEGISLEGDGAWLTRNHEAHTAGARGDLRTDLGRIEFEIPVFRFEDHRDVRNEVTDATYRVGLHRAYRDYYWSLSYGAQIGRLPYFDEEFTYEDLQAAGMAANVFGFDDFNARLQLQYQSRPHDVVRNMHVKDRFLGDLNLSIVPIERSSVQFGIARRTANIRRLNPYGMALATPGSIPSYAQIEAVKGYEDNQPLETETYVKLHLNKWRKLTGNYRYSHVDVNQVPPTDVVVRGTTILTPHQMEAHQYKLSWTPGRRVGIHGMRSTDERRNDNRSIGTRSDYSDVYAYLMTFNHLTTGLGWSSWEHFASQPIVSDLLEGVKSYLVDLTWDMRNGFAIFVTLRKMSYDGVREATERIGETGIRFANGGRAGFDGRISFAWNELDDRRAPANDYSWGSVNVAATAKF